MNIYDYYTLTFLCLSVLLLIVFFVFYKMDWDYIVYIGFFMTFCIIATGVSAMMARTLDENITLGSHYATQCKLLEINIDNGFLSSKTNKIECDGVIDNVSTNNYNNAISAYQDSLK